MSCSHWRQRCRYGVPRVFLLLLLLSISAYSAVNAKEEEDSCGLWLAPSHIKEREDHGYGLGMYTGRRIVKGEDMSSELFLPLFDFDSTEHPPLREYLWSGEAYKQIVLEVYDNLLFFSPGLSAIAPCTSNNFNLERVDNVSFDNSGVHRSKDPTTGAFAYHHQPMFRAVRDIEPGEELTVECQDDDFDGGDYTRTLFDPKDDKVTCLDDKLEERERSNIPGVGRGVFAKKNLAKDTVVLSSPAVPVHRKLLHITSEHASNLLTQLLINYCYGRPGSDLLWFPYGPLINSINHYGSAPNTPNVKVQWHADPIASNEDLARRKQYHHPELLDYTPERVALTHGKGLVMDVVAIRDIKEGEEIYLDYGKSWTEAWKAHEAKYKASASKLEGGEEESYIPAAEYNRLYSDEPVRTITEQRRDPYPRNILTACRFLEDWIEDENAEDYDMIQYQSWNTQSSHFNCLLPCIILERLEGEDTTTYTAKLVDHHHDNDSIEWDCHIFRAFEYIYTDIPREGIEFIENTYSSDVFLPAAFRQPIEVSEGMYPEHWTKQKLRRRTTSAHVATPEEIEEEQQFKRKDIEPGYDKEDIQWKKFASPREDL